MGRPDKALRTVLEGAIDEATSRRQRRRTDAEELLLRIRYHERVATADLVALFSALLYIQQSQDSIAADRYHHLRR